MNLNRLTIVLFYNAELLTDYEISDFNTHPLSTLQILSEVLFGEKMKIIHSLI